MKFDEYRGVRGLMCAEVLTDDDASGGYTTEPWFWLSGVQAVTSEKNESSEAKYYDNAARIVIDAEGADNVTLVVSALANKTRAKIEGAKYDADLDMIVDTPRKKKYFAIGYIGEKTDGTEEFVICYKGKFTGGSITRNTKNDGTDSTNVEYTFTGVHTSSKIYTNAEGEKETAKSVSAPFGDVLTEKAIFGELTDDVSSVTALTPDAIKALKTA